MISIFDDPLETITARFTFSGCSRARLLGLIVAQSSSSHNVLSCTSVASRFPWAHHLRLVSCTSVTLPMAARARSFKLCKLPSVTGTRWYVYDGHAVLFTHVPARQVVFPGRYALTTRVKNTFIVSSCRVSLVARPAFPSSHGHG
jgi:hypothetical protein